ncbi:FG-GAP repeat domain-containing protein [Microbacterium sp. GXF0217]
MPRITRILTVFLAAMAVTIGTAIPASAATTVTTGVSAPIARVAVEPASSGIVKTSLAGFTPGNLISDAVFTNRSSMTEAQIQTFFNSKVKTCRSGYTCLKDFRISSVDRPADTYCRGYTGAANESAARIIYRVAQSCGINPQVLIVMLQKEQGLINHTWPSQWRYDKALGQGCPDGGVPCNPRFVGFFHQIYGAARQMQIYMEGKYFSWYAPGKTWNIRYDVEVSCGSSPVYIANKATAAMYYYTPYQPNAAALRAGYGTGDSCSAYGNRNFYNYFTDWFGSTQKPAAPAPAGPTLTSLNKADYTLALNTNGTLWAYPFAKGVWGTRVQVANGLTGTSKVIGVGDLNGDGHRDFVAVAKNGQASAIYGNGTSTFAKPQVLKGVGAESRLVTAAGDFDSDGVPDLFTVTASGALMLWRGDNRGGFHDAVQVGRGWGQTNLIVGGMDFTGDGIPDLIGRGISGRLWLYVGSGNGNWATTQLIGKGWSGVSDLYVPGDFTGDGVNDLVAKTKTGALVLYRGAGNGALGSTSSIGTGWGAMAIAHMGAKVSSKRPLSAGVGNVDARLGRDVLAVSRTGSLLLYRGDGDGGWAGARTLGSGWSSKDKLLPLGDFNGDGYPDAARIDSKGAFRVVPGLPGGKFGTSVIVGRGWSGLVPIASGIDFDGDRNPDVVVRNAVGALLLYRGNGAGGWAASTGVQIGQKWGAINAAFYAGDFNGDGHGDIIARKSDGTLWLYPTNGSGGWGTASKIGTGWQGMTAMISPGDFDGDGATDVLGRVKDGRLILYRGNGSGSWDGTTVVGKGWNNILLLG